MVESKKKTRKVLKNREKKEWLDKRNLAHEQEMRIQELSIEEHELAGQVIENTYNIHDLLCKASESMDSDDDQFFEAIDKVLDLHEEWHRLQDLQHRNWTLQEANARVS